MCNSKQLSALELNLLQYVNTEGGKNVPMCPASVSQNKNFYSRVKKLERLKFLKVKRYDGKASDFTITLEGKAFLQSIIENEIKETENDSQFLISLVEASSLSSGLKEKVLDILSH